MLRLASLTLARDRVSPVAVFCTPVYIISVGEVVAERTRQLTRVVVILPARCSQSVVVHLTLG